VIFGPVKFDVEARRIYGIRSVKLVVKDGAFTQWDGSKPVASAN
jgi:branched-chain amino acid transport system substrate-binding protein